MIGLDICIEISAVTYSTIAGSVKGKFKARYWVLGVLINENICTKEKISLYQEAQIHRYKI